MRALIVIIWRCFSCGRGKKLLPWQQRPCPHPLTNDPSRIRSEPPLNPHNSIFQSSIEQELKVGSKIRSKMLRTMLDPSRHGNSAPLGGQCGSLPLKMLSKCCSNAVQMLSEWNCSNGKAKEQEKVVAYQSASSAGGLSPLTLTWSRLHWPLALSYFSFWLPRICWELLSTPFPPPPPLLPPTSQYQRNAPEPLWMLKGERHDDISVACTNWRRACWLHQSRDVRIRSHVVTTCQSRLDPLQLIFGRVCLCRVCGLMTYQ